MPIIGTRSAWAMALAVGDADPQAGEQAGAEVDGDTLISSSSMPACAQTNSMAGVSVSAWRATAADLDEASTPSWPPMAQPT